MTRVKKLSPPLTLRNRLILSLLGLIALVGLIIGVVSTLTLDSFLMNRLDHQLTAASTRSLSALGQPAPTRLPETDDGRTPDSFLGRGGQSTGTLGALTSNGIAAVGAVLNEKGVTRALTDPELAALSALTPSTKPQTVALGGTLGDYRVSFDLSPSGRNVIVGLPLADVKATTTQLVIVIVSVTLAGLVLAAFLATLIIRLALRPLDRIVATATRVTELQLDRGEVALAERVPASDTDPRTEVGRVGVALNRMLGHVASALTSRQASENKVRKFVADASHELRTPLASIRGYAELTRRGGETLPPDVAHSLGRIESEATRMTSLVEDLLLLARLDDKPELAMDEVDLTSLVVDAVSDAHVTSRDHEWLLELPDEPILVSGDAPRLHQVLGNLLANARVHTPAGTRVTTALESGFDPQGLPIAVMTVSDNGPGIDPALVPTLFERFVRGDASRYRAPGSTSTGLGLAIVSAVVEAQRGTVTARSIPGETVFTVTLPLLPAGAPLAGAAPAGASDIDPADLNPEDFATFDDVSPARPSATD